ncbi:MAG: Hsp20/alpha crystallin family protein [candidate division KSB1 bacterium]|nr:Hsp20/alpha crystallin family protein [candidate division KSB1 bacterium]MDZ7336492.1 Hsp20/alpha crystallin family protein [candidate division KSB1 bacterium]MDZ7356928.1 Hsp20/alpha crystallin family protein [candidate division KSB1 bacterium]MDZ7375181.1 Hsp20/alpha crystallin family protein [candidate division KSB1 bacterium]MDZ7399241.1 Hsp20/alpha crystallin family protein [candidate division KSB1 bacterium]
MAIIRWRPLSEIDSFRREMDRMFDTFFGTSSEVAESTLAWYPSVDIKETKDDFVLTAEVPGINKDDIKISISENTLTIKGEKKEEKKEETENYHRLERRYGTFQRSFTLPTQVEDKKVKASYKDGVLTITLPKKEEVKPKEIPITVS